MRFRKPKHWICICYVPSRNGRLQQVAWIDPKTDEVWQNMNGKILMVQSGNFTRSCGVHPEVEYSRFNRYGQR